MTDFAPTDLKAARRRTLSLPARGGDMALIEMGDPERPVDLVFAHANGFNALTYRTVMAPLAERFRILMPDLRGHGRTGLPVQTAGRRGWDDLGDDLAALLDTIEAEMKDAPDRLQWAMNTCLAQIGIVHPEHRARAIDIGERLEVLKDYPTPPNCTSPYAPTWIGEIVRRREGA